MPAGAFSSASAAAAPAAFAGAIDAASQSKESATMSTSNLRIARVSRFARLAFGPALVALAAWTSGADLPKAGSFAVTTTITATAPAAFDIGGGRWAAIFEARTIAINDAGSGLFHHTSGHCIWTESLPRRTADITFHRLQHSQAASNV
jgi:hypothetical protein